MPTPHITFHRCEHIKVNGIQCGSPALRAKRRCFFHDHCSHLCKQMEPDLAFISSLEDANSIQLGIAEVIRMLVLKHVDATTASLLLRALRLAATNVKFTSFEPKSAQVVVDPSAIEDRCAGGRATFDPYYETAETLPETSPEKARPEKTNETGHQKSAADRQSVESPAPNQAQPVKSAIPQYMRELIRRFHEQNELYRLMRPATPSEIAKLAETAKLPAITKLPATAIIPPSAQLSESTKLSASTQLPEDNKDNEDNKEPLKHDQSFQDAPPSDLEIPDPSTFPNSEITGTAQESCH